MNVSSSSVLSFLSVSTLKRIFLQKFQTLIILDAMRHALPNAVAIVPLATKLIPSVSLRCVLIANTTPVASN